MRIEQGVKVVKYYERFCFEKYDDIPEGEYIVSENTEIDSGVIKVDDGPGLLPVNIRKISVETAIKIAKLLNDSLKRGEV